MESCTALSTIESKLSTGKLVVSVLDNGHVCSGLIVASRLSMYGGNATLYDAISMGELEASRCCIPRLSRRDYDDIDKDIKANKVHYGMRYLAISMSSKYIVNVFEVENLDNFPRTAEWSSLTHDQALDISNKLILEENEKINEFNRSIVRKLEEDWEFEHMIEDADLAYAKLSRREKKSLGKEDNERIRSHRIKYAREHQGSISKNPLHDYWEKQGVIKCW